MTEEEMADLYFKATGHSIANSPKYVVRVWDSGDGCWVDIESDVLLKTALAAWLNRTANGTKATRYTHGDYYAIFPADTKMPWSGTNTMKGE